MGIRAPRSRSRVLTGAEQLRQHPPVVRDGRRDEARRRDLGRRQRASALGSREPAAYEPDLAPSQR